MLSSVNNSHCLIIQDNIKERFDSIVANFVSMSKDLLSLHYDPKSAKWQGENDVGVIDSKDGSDSDSSGADGIEKDVKVRLLFLACLQTLIKTNPKEFHAWWRSLVSIDPVPDGDLGAKSSQKCGTLTHAAVLDPSPKVRHSAAASLSTLFEGPAQRAYLSIAEAPSDSVRGFVSLSQSLGQIIITNIETMRHYIPHESTESSKCAMIRALATIVVGCSWERLPLEHAMGSIETIFSCVHDAIQHDFSDSKSNTVVSCLAALSHIFGSKVLSGVGFERLKENLFKAHGGWESLTKLLFQCCKENNLMYQFDAASIIRSIIRCISDQRDLQPFVEESLQLCDQLNIHADFALMQDNSISERATQQIILLFGDVISACHSLDYDSVQSFKEGEPSRKRSHMDAMAHKMEKKIRAAIETASEKIRSSAYCAVSCLQKGDWTEERRGVYLNLICSAMHDSNSTVRSSALKALNSIILAGYPFQSGTNFCAISLCKTRAHNNLNQVALQDGKMERSERPYMLQWISRF